MYTIVDYLRKENKKHHFMFLQWGRWNLQSRGKMCEDPPRKSYCPQRTVLLSRSASFLTGSENRRIMSNISWFVWSKPELLGIFDQWALQAPPVCLENTRHCTETGFYNLLGLFSFVLTFASMASWITSTISSTMAASRLFLPAMPASLATKRQMDMDWQIFSPFKEKCLSVWVW